MKKQKTVAIVHACQSREQTIDAIRELGDAQRELLRVETEINDILAQATAEGTYRGAHRGHRHLVRRQPRGAVSGRRQNG